MKGKFQIFALSILLILTTVFSSFSIRTPIPGVVVDDYFTYEMYGVYNSKNSNTTISIPEFEKNNTDWTRIAITAINGSSVSQIYTLHFKNDSETVFPFQTNLGPQSQAASRISEKGVPVCSSNLNPGDQIPAADVTINQTVLRMFADGARETNYACWSSMDEWGEIYFDRKTGMLVELERTHRFVNPATGYIFEKTDYICLINTNRWQVNN